MESKLKYYDIKQFQGVTTNLTVKDGKVHDTRSPIDRWMIGITWDTIKRQAQKRGHAIY